MKETEEEILKRIKANPKEIILCRQYHESMIKSILPTEQEIDGMSMNHKDPDQNDRQESAYYQGWEDGYKKAFKDALTLLTKGEGK